MTKNEQIKISQAAKNYAQALTEIAKDGNPSYEVLANDLKIVSEAFSNSNELIMALENPAIDSDVKTDIINTIFSGKISNEVLNFIKIITDKKRISEFPAIYTEFQNRLYKLQNIRPVTVISAVKLNSTQQNTIVEKLANKLNKKILPNWEINKDIIAGIMIKIDDNVLDMSLKNRIEKLGKSLMLK